MRIASYELDGSRSFGAVVGDEILDLSARLEFRSFRELLTAGALDRARELVEREPPTDVALDSVALLPPVPDPSKIVAIGANYMSHIEEVPLPKAQLLTDVPVTFIRLPESLVGHGQPLVRPNAAEHFDYEGELAVVIGKHAWHVSKEDAYDHVAGYSAANEGSIREWLFHTPQWTPGKNFWRTGAWGPWIVTSDEAADVEQHTITTRVNGEQRQHDSLANHIFDIPTCINYITQWTPLQPGDVILMGTPAGCGGFNKDLLLQPGDTVEVEVSFVGTPLMNDVVDEEHAPSPSLPTSR